MGTEDQLRGIDYVLENRQLHNVNIDNAMKNGTVTANHKTSASSENVSLFSGNSFIMPDKEDRKSVV